MHPELLLAARTALGLTREALADKANVGERTLSDLEGTRGGSLETYLLVKKALEDLGIEFMPAGEGKGPGFRLPGEWKGSVLVRPRKKRRPQQET